MRLSAEERKERRLYALINRKLGSRDPYGEKLHKTRGERWRYELGSYYITDNSTSGLVSRHIEDLEELAREVLNDEVAQ